MRNFVLVTATRAEPDKTPVVGSGIRKLKRGVSLPQFISEYLGAACPGNVDILKRDGTYTAVSRAEGAAYSWSFTEYPEDELLTAVANLTREELLRDLKELLPLKAAQ